MIIGRDQQVAGALGLITAVHSGAGGPCVLFVTGDAGIGKSTLLGAIAAACAGLDPAPVTASVECSTPLAGADLGEVESLEPWARLLTSLSHENSSTHADTRTIVVEVARAWLGCVPVVGQVLESAVATAEIIKKNKIVAEPVAASQEQLFQQYINVLRKLSERRPLVLMLDDFHWADTSSTNLLFAAARQLAGHPVVFVVAYRADDAASGRGGEGHPILHVRNELERYSMCAEIGVPQMTPENLDTLLRTRYPNYHNSDEFEEWIARVSGGNPLFITQYLKTLEEDGMIDRDRGEIRPGFQSIRVPTSAQSVVQERIRRLDEDSRELLRYASVEGDTFTASVLAKVVETPQLKLLQRLRMIEERHGIIHSLGKQRVYASETSAFEFAHALCHRAMYEALGEEEREMLHEMMLDVLRAEWEARASSAGLQGMALRLATHAGVLGQHRFAAEVLYETARESWRSRWSADESMKQVAVALDHLDKLPLSSASSPEVSLLKGNLALLSGEIKRLRGRYDESLELFARAAELCTAGGSVERTIDAMNERAELLTSLDRLEEAESIITEADALAGSNGYVAGRADSLMYLGTVRFYQQRYDESHALYAQALELAKQSSDSGDHATALVNLACAKFALGDTPSALESLRDALAIFESNGDVRVGATLGNIGEGLLESGDVAGALEHFERALSMHRSTGDRENEASTLLQLASAHRVLGNIDEAAAYASRGRELAVELGLSRLVDAADA